MPYRHAGSIGDIWKHPPLCEILLEQKPRVYVGSNSASPEHIIYSTPEKLYGIYHYMQNYHKSEVLSKARYTSLIEKTWHDVDVNVDINKYLGSPGLALGALKNCTEKFIFYDLEQEALDTIRMYAKAHHKDVKLKTIRGDSIEGVLKMLDSLTPHDFVFMDPYTILDPNNHGHTYLDVFTEVATRKIPVLLWYGFNTGKDQTFLHNKIQEQLILNHVEPKKCRIHTYEIYMALMQEEEIVYNPGILGCGLLAANLSERSVELLHTFQKEIVDIYRGSKVKKTYPGDLKPAYRRFD